MEWYHAVILGLVEGITEFLPVSSTGHLIVAASLMGLTDDGTKAAIDAFIIIMQGCSLLAIVGLYWPRMKQMMMGLLGRDPAGLRLFTHIVIAFLPILIAGPTFYGPIKEYLFKPGPVLAALALGGAWMIWIDRRRKKLGEGAYSLEIEDMTWKHALGIGLFQVLSIWPGTSRAMMTIAGGTVLGLKPARAAEFSFLLGLPAIGGATVYELYKEFYRDGGDDGRNMIVQLGWAPMLIGCIVTVIAAAVTVKWLVAFLNHHGLAAFGWYRIALAAVMGGLIAMGLVTLA